MKLKVKVAYEWEENADEILSEIMDEGFTLDEAKVEFINRGYHIDAINKLDTRASNCLPSNYKYDVKWNWTDV